MCIRDSIQTSLAARLLGLLHKSVELAQKEILAVVKKLADAGEIELQEDEAAMIG